MKNKLKSQNGAITVIALVTMLFILFFLMTIHIRVSNKAQSSAEATEEIRRKYLKQQSSKIDLANEGEVIPISSVEELCLIGSNQKKEINGIVYTFSSDAYYALQTDLDLGGSNNPWTPLPLEDENNVQYSFTGYLDGLGHIITGLYINEPSSNNLGLFGTLNGTVKNINLQGSYVNGNNYVGSIAGENNGTIIICNNNVTGGYFTEINDNNNTPVSVWTKQKILTQNYKFISGQDEAIVPKGFKVSADVLEQTIADGMVIQDEDGNEFVWVPVPDGTFLRTVFYSNATFEEIAASSSETLRNTFFTEYKSKDSRLNYSSYDLAIQNEPDINSWADIVSIVKAKVMEIYAEDDTTDPTGKYNDMVTSVEYYQGFYVGRFEAGTLEERTDGTAAETDVIVKKHVYSYKYIKWGARYQLDNTGAVYLCQKMYNDDSYGVVSTLCYGIQWDSVLKFLKDRGSVSYSQAWGNYGPSEFNYITADKKQAYKPKPSYLLVQTGASEHNKLKNIYDFAGNLSEWTMELFVSNDKFRVFRGGDYHNGTDPGAAYRERNHYPWAGDSNIGFRPTLYIKNPTTS